MLGMGLTLRVGRLSARDQRAKQVAYQSRCSTRSCPRSVSSSANSSPSPGPSPWASSGRCCPGGTAEPRHLPRPSQRSALRGFPTTASTFLACALTPLMTKTLAGTLVPVPASGLFASTLQVVLLPILGGLALKRWFPDAVKKVTPFCPPFAVATVGSCAPASSAPPPPPSPPRAARSSPRWRLRVRVRARVRRRVRVWISRADRRTVSIELGCKTARSASCSRRRLRGSARGGAVRDIGDGALVPGSALAGTWRALDDGKNRA